MESNVQGAWLVHHTSKLQSFEQQAGFDTTYLAGKAGILLSAISASNEITIDRARLEALAVAAKINTTFELPRLLETLKDRKLVDVGDEGVSILGITTTSALQHTASIFEASKPTNIERAALGLAEMASLEPIHSKEAAEELSDTFKLTQRETARLLQDSESFGFVDVEDLGTGSLYFNGNLFRRENTRKLAAVLATLKTNEQAALSELTAKLRSAACVPVDSAKLILGNELFSKTSAVGLFDINVVSNSSEEVGFLTLPSAFSKYSTSIVEDAFDLAKAFVSSITYGITKSYHERGKITMVKALLQTLVCGEPVGPVPAIAEDYKILEYKGVIHVFTGTKKGRTGPMMKLLKKEVGELALQVISSGDISEESLKSLPTAAISRFVGPEVNRTIARRKQIQMNASATNDILSVLRRGGGL